MSTEGRVGQVMEKAVPAVLYAVGGPPLFAVPADKEFADCHGRMQLLMLPRTLISIGAALTLGITLCSSRVRSFVNVAKLKPDTFTKVVAPLAMAAAAWAGASLVGGHLMTAGLVELTRDED